MRLHVGAPVITEIRKNNRAKALVGERNGVDTMNVGDVVKLNDRFGHIKNKNNMKNGDIGFIIANNVKTEVNPFGTCIKVLFTDGTLVVAHCNNFELYRRCAT
jgi:hypothetical protein